LQLIDRLMKKTDKIDFLFPRTFDDLMHEAYYDYDKFEWFLYYAFQLDGVKVQKLGRKGRGDGGADLILTVDLPGGGVTRIGIQAKYWKNRVGTEPINQLASAKSRHGLQELWIITTSDLTPDAKEIAESMDIKILRKEDVENIIEDIIDKYEKQVEEKGESQIEFLTPVRHQKKDHKKTKSIKKKDDNKVKGNEEDFRKLRYELSKKHKVYPVYMVFGNNTIKDLAEKMPKTLKELEGISGIGQVKIKQFGQEIIDFINSKQDSNTNKKKTLTKDQELYKLLISERVKIARYNKLKQSDVYTDRVADNLVKMKPKTKNDLKKVYGFKEENIDIFGDYLIRIINR